MIDNVIKIKSDLRKLSNIQRAKNSQWFFKTERGGYGEGDKFLGVTVPDQRKIAKKYYDSITFDEIKKLLYSTIHEERLVALLILVFKYEKTDKNVRKQIFEFYMSNRKQINNWDLVDTSAHKIVGAYLVNNSRKILYKLAKSKSLWDRRIAIISTAIFIKNQDFYDTLEISKILLKDKEDLIHKAVGWMLREVGNSDMKVEELYLKKHYKSMPRTMLRYAIEKFPNDKRKAYLNGNI